MLNHQRPAGYFFPGYSRLGQPPEYSPRNVADYTAPHPLLHIKIKIDCRLAPHLKSFSDKNQRENTHYNASVQTQPRYLRLDLRE